MTKHTITPPPAPSCAGKGRLKMGQEQMPRPKKIGQDLNEHFNQQRGRFGRSAFSPPAPTSTLIYRS